MMVSLSAIVPVSAQDGGVSKGSVFAPPPSEDLNPDEEGISSDLEFFLKAGYQAPDFNVYYNLRHEVGTEIVVPDYVKRTGKVPPDDVRVEVASIYLTGGDFNDIVVYSFLPGDCGLGCLAQVYRTPDGLKWEKILEFTSYAFAYKSAISGQKAQVVSVGGTNLDSKIYEWDGKSFALKP
jgi:hypothetical protein